jgi:integrase
MSFLAVRQGWRLISRHYSAVVSYRESPRICKETDDVAHSPRCGNRTKWTVVHRATGLTTRGTALSHDALQYMLDKHVPVARRPCPSLARKRLTPHVLRHTLAMDLLHHGADQTLIALWLGHESPETTSIYLHADMQLKERALATTTAKKVPVPRFRPSDRVMDFLKGL